MLDLRGLLSLSGHDAHGFVDLLLLLGLDGCLHLLDGLGLGLSGLALLGIGLLLVGEFGALLGDLLLGLGAADSSNKGVPPVGRANGELLNSESQLSNLFVVPAVVGALGLLRGTVLLGLGSVGV